MSIINQYNREGDFLSDMEVRCARHCMIRFLISPSQPKVFVILLNNYYSICPQPYSTSLVLTVPERMYWQDVGRCRQFFDDYAREHGFDPLQPRAWYTVNFS